jgi:hypothetical protein
LSECPITCRNLRARVGISRARQAPPDLRSPYEEAGLSASLYLEWASTAKPAAIWQLMERAIGAYERAHGALGAAAGGGPEDEETMRGRAVARMIQLLGEDWVRSASSAST